MDHHGYQRRSLGPVATAPPRFVGLPALPFHQRIDKTARIAP